MLRSGSVLNPTNPLSQYGPVTQIEGDDGLKTVARPFLIGQVGILSPAVYAKSQNAGDEATSSPKIGYMIHHTHWGLGLASRAARAFLDGYWAVLNPPSEPRDEVMDVIEAHIDPANVASEHVAVKLGFEPGEESGDAFRLASSAEWRKMRIWRLHRPASHENM